MATMAVTAEGDAVNCVKVAEAMTAIPDEFPVDEPTLEALVAMIAQRLQIAKRVMQEKLAAKETEPVAALEKAAKPVAALEKVAEPVAAVLKAAEPVAAPEKTAKPVAALEKTAKPVAALEKAAEPVAALEKAAELVVDLEEDLVKAPSSNREGPPLQALIAVGVAVVVGAVILLARRRK
ncbi:hypothetical protein T492DRAFT_932923 [Pavlovales sp. CCMP2436]|nr:hypothetical protein T492DRAFT_932923 [Pavlovales sp. CCMP2436]|mmetsp:Transcript_44949/g.111396  ORF Transcript_44949/g.111396 Transcript_44949/m.111396 type:complete len:180 (-) Transcript_44949:206-745(-)